MYSKITSCMVNILNGIGICYLIMLIMIHGNFESAFEEDVRMFSKILVWLSLGGIIYLVIWLSVMGLDKVINEAYIMFCCILLVWVGLGTLYNFVRHKKVQKG